MVLVLKNDQMENLVPMNEEIDAIEQAFRELGQGKAMVAPRARLRTPWKEEGGQYYFNNIMGLVPGMKSMALRIDSSFSKEIQVEGSKRRVYPGDFIGLVMLFDMDTCNILAIMDDHFISTMRVGATSAVASKYLARKDAKVMALLGSGEQAKTQVTAHLSVRQLTEGQSLQPDQSQPRKIRQGNERRNRHRSGAREFRRRSDPRQRHRHRRDEYRRSGDPREMGRIRHAFEQHRRRRRLSAAQRIGRRSGIESQPYRGRLQAANLSRQASRVSRSPRTRPGQSRRSARAGRVVNGKCRGREADKEITFFKNNTGMGIQFAATAHKMYEKAKEKGIGTELPLELFMTQRGDKAVFSMKGLPSRSFEQVLFQFQGPTA